MAESRTAGVSGSTVVRTAGQPEFNGLFVVSVGEDRWRATPWDTAFRLCLASTRCAAETPVGVSELEATVEGTFEHSDTASAQYRTRPFTWTDFEHCPIAWGGAPLSDWLESLCFQPIRITRFDCLPLNTSCVKRRYCFPTRSGLRVTAVVLRLLRR